MEATETIERIKKLEEAGKKQIQSAEAEKDQTLKKAREQAIVLLDEFEKTKEAHISEKISVVENEAKKDAQKITAKAEKEAEEIGKKAAEKVTPVSNKIFENFKKSLLE